MRKARYKFGNCIMRVRAPDTDNWEKLCHLMEHLRGDHDQPLILSGNNEGVLMWYVDASFAVHPNMCGHTGGCLTMECGLTNFSIY
jgi:hypothetical protein